jgi:voltage-gated potassium channel
MDSSFMSHSHPPVHPRQPTRHPAPHRAVKLRAPQWLDMGLVQMLSFGAAVLMACGVGYWLFDPAIDSLEDGVWLAFTTAATVGYGDIVPTSTTARVFSVIVVLLGFAILSMVTARIAAKMVGTQERRIEQEILHDLHAQVKLLRNELAEVKARLPQPVEGSAPPDAEPQPPHTPTQTLNSGH